ncbi:hypothetical protein BU24DRAFT_424367 [Aaosphaeria arxii CBS 175.79]|uniref:Secreted protein n=1 Tax=Aaosphaeria arxii CBS 175.79 TaxID=1450172 RepID=A0A6A5XK79_9PLEO|nr:uncharacterized protein BU24DRAFT_424367 [Aaosphaeria arxii CBS 175.79]KAF2013363.1 hypothetical protein BU24DRAFT_424367 [Aaosphaeria arxii CBS 175.79]
MYLETLVPILVVCSLTASNPIGGDCSRSAEDYPRKEFFPSWWTLNNRNNWKRVHLEFREGNRSPMSGRNCYSWCRDIRKTS